MIRIFFFIIFVSAFILLFGLVELLLLRQLNRVWWEKKWIRRTAWSLPVIGVVSLVLLGLAEYHRINWLSAVVSPVTVLAVVLEICLMISLPFSGAVHLTERLLGWMARRRKTAREGVPDQRRRVFLKGAAAVVPLATISAGLGGVGRAYGAAEVRLKPFRIARLPDGLEGLRVLHLSDLHLGHYVTIDDLEDILACAAQFSPDLVLVTGDVSDDLEQLPAVLDKIAALSPPLGCYAILGNHEYFRGIVQVRAIYARSPVPLMVNEHVVIKAGTTDLLLGGIDDPVTMHDIAPDFFPRNLDTAFSSAPRDAFPLLMSHRPDVFPFAAERKIGLTLAGHTHGGQIGLGGRSILEGAFPHSYLWGKYALGDSLLYTTSGAGHWFPFRLGCPTEAPVIELHRA
jgi:predicted MPP superfamily phosphohydrolase